MMTDATQKIYPQLKALVNEHGEAIDVWFAEAYAKAPPLFYCSLDIRHSGHKIAPVDTNLFPAGFNLLSQEAAARAVERARAYFSAVHAEVKRVVLVPESHTRNTYYLENVYTLKGILEGAGMEVRLGALQLKEGQTKLETHSGKQLEIQALTRDGDTVLVEGFTPDMVIVNNDLTSGAPEILREAAQPVIPPVGLGWYQRRKTTHFDTYSELARQFCQPYDIDPWLISTMFHHCGNVNFKEQTGIECVALGVEKVLRQLEQKYAQYGITEKPYVFIKADSGTYGMGIMAVHAAEEVFEMNKKTRKKMQTIKEGTQNTRVIIQEGVPTVDMVEGKVAEPLLYLIAGEVVGCTYRVNEHRDAYGNLNAPGMTFAHACEEDKETGDGAEPNAHCPVLGLIGRLAALAAARECYEPRWDI